MKLIELTVKNINSLRNTQKIEFDKPPLSGENLFLITGPTGSGKTTILDAITTALFDRTPRLSSKNTRMLKNQSEKSAAIELVFELGGHVYKHLWQVDKNDLKKISAYKNGELIAGVRVNNIEKHSAELLGLEYDSFTKTVILAQNKFDDFLKARPEERRKIIETVTGNEILEKIKTAIKDDYEKYKNDHSFQKIKLDALLANIGGRDIDIIKKDITEKHAALEKKRNELQAIRVLKTSLERLNAAFNELEAEKKKLSGLNGSFDFTAAQTELKNLKTARDHFREPLRKLSENETGLKEIENKIELETREISNIDDALKKHCGEQAEMKERKALFDKNYEIQKADLIKAAALKGQMEPLESSLALKKDRAGDMQFHISGNSAEAEAVSEKLAVIEKNIVDASMAIDSFSQFEGTDDRLNAFKNNFEKFNLRTNDIAKLEKEAGRLNSQIAKIELEISEMSKTIESAEMTAGDARKKIAACEIQKERVSAEFETSSISNAASEIRSKLKEGCACPVCGSIEHPALNNDAGNLCAAGKTPLELKNELKEINAEIKELEKKAACAESEKNTALSSSALLQKSRDEKNQEIGVKNVEIKNICAERGSLLKALETPDLLKGLAADDAVKKWEDALKTLKSASAALEKYEKEKILVRSRFEKILLETQHYTNNKNELTKEMDAIVSQLNLLAGEFRTLTQNRDPDERLNELEAEKNYIKSGSDKLDKTVSELNTRKISRQDFIIKSQPDLAKFKDGVSACEKLIREKCFETGLEIHLAGKLAQSTAGIDKLEQIYNLRSMEKNRIEARIEETERILKAEPFDALKLENAKDEEAAKNIEIDLANREIGEISNQLTEIEKLEGEFKKVKEEFELLNKDFSAAELLYQITKDNQFRDFVLSFHMDGLLALASQYLKKLTGGRYEFAYAPESANQIFIKDYLNEGLTREISTISGGESFMASLSLALALSQISAGNKSIDFMFLDEGFGVLDSEALEDVLEMINKLNDIGKKIGVISHIREVRERIATWIEITKQPDGSSVIKV